MAIISVVAATGMSMMTSSLNRVHYTDSTDKIAEITEALHRFYAANSRLPCPAQGTLKLGDTGFGQEIYYDTVTKKGLCDAVVTPANAAAPAGTTRIHVTTDSDLDDLNGGTARDAYVRQGTVPTRALGLSDAMMYDNYGNKYTYVVTEAFTTGATTGAITVNDGTANADHNRLVTAVFAVISHGKDKKGAYGKSGATGVACGASANLDVENCDFATESAAAAPTDVLLTDTQFNEGNIAASFFDDIIKWEDKDTVIGLTSGGSSSGGGSSGEAGCGGTLCIKYTAATYTGNLVATTGGDAECNAEYSGYHICTMSEFYSEGRIGGLPHADTYPLRLRGLTNAAFSCPASVTTYLLGASDDHVTWNPVYTQNCTQPSAIACCKSNP